MTPGGWSRDPGTRIVLVPGALALLPEYAAIADPVAPLRTACLGAVSWLVAAGAPVTVHASGPQGLRVATHLVHESGGHLKPDDCTPEHGGTSWSSEAVLVVANGSARRSEKAPGHLDARASAFDDAVRTALCGPDPTALAGLDPSLARELWADVGALASLGALLDGQQRADVAYDDDPYGVQYWVIRWS